MALWAGTLSFTMQNITSREFSNEQLPLIFWKAQTSSVPYKIHNCTYVKNMSKMFLSTHISEKLMSHVQKCLRFH